MSPSGCSLLGGAHLSSSAGGGGHLVLEWDHIVDNLLLRCCHLLLSQTALPAPVTLLGDGPVPPLRLVFLRRLVSAADVCGGGVGEVGVLGAQPEPPPLDLIGAN